MDILQRWTIPNNSTDPGQFALEEVVRLSSAMFARLHQIYGTVTSVNNKISIWDYYTGLNKSLTNENFGWASRNIYFTCLRKYLIFSLFKALLYTRQVNEISSASPSHNKLQYGLIQLSLEISLFETD